MTTLNFESIKEEAERVTAEKGYYIPPYRLHALFKAAEKFLKVISDVPERLTYTEIRVLLKIIGKSIDIAIGEEDLQKEEE